MEAKIQSKGWFLVVDKGDDEKFRDLNSGKKFFSKCVFWVDLYEGLLDCIS
jgi:hypothetical protein